MWPALVGLVKQILQIKQDREFFPQFPPNLFFRMHRLVNPSDQNEGRRRAIVNEGVHVATMSPVLFCTPWKCLEMLGFMLHGFGDIKGHPRWKPFAKYLILFGSGGGTRTPDTRIMIPLL